MIVCRFSSRNLRHYRIQNIDRIHCYRDKYILRSPKANSPLVIKWQSYLNADIQSTDLKVPDKGHHMS